MPAPKIIRPGESFSEDKQKDLLTYLCDHYDRAERSRVEQMEKYKVWDQIYRAIPLEKKRTVPWSGASNLVVPLARIYLDTFVARTLNIIFATRPLYVNDGFPREEKEALEMYINRKALYEWNHYELCASLMGRGNKNGTVVGKTTYREDRVWRMLPAQGGSSGGSEEVVTYDGPCTELIPYEDFCLYPFTVTDLCKALILFHKIRYVEEEAKQRIQEGKWLITEADMESALQMPNDVNKKQQEQEDAGVQDPYLRELHLVEAHLEWEMQPGKRFKMVVLLEPEERKLVDIQFSNSVDQIFHDYRPFPREDIYWGESQCQILQQQQEEASRIHNERRDNSFIANAPVFLRKNGSNLPNPSTVWYPGKVWDLDDLADLSIQSFGRNIDGMLDQEAGVFQLADRIVGMGGVMQGMASGSMDKRGVYNTSGTLAVMGESNQRQDTNIRDVRQALGRIAKCEFQMQREWGLEDPTIEMFPSEIQEKIKSGLALVTNDKLRRSFFEVKVSNAGANKEVERANLIQMAQVLAQYGQTAVQMATQLASPNLTNPVIRQVMTEVCNMQKWMAARLVRAWDEADGEGELPDVIKALGLGSQPGGGQGAPGQAVPGGAPQGMDLGGATAPGGSLSREGLEILRSLPVPSQGNGAAGGPPGQTQ